MPTTDVISRQSEEYTGKLGEQAKKSIDNATQSLKNQSEDAWKEVVRYMKENPAKSLGIALATGAVLGVSIASLARGNRSSARSHIQGLAVSGADAWSRVKAGFDDALCSLKDAFEDAGSKFK